MDIKINETYHILLNFLGMNTAIFNIKVKSVKKRTVEDGVKETFLHFNAINNDISHFDNQNKLYRVNWIEDDIEISREDLIVINNYTYSSYVTIIAKYPQDILKYYLKCIYSKPSFELIPNKGTICRVWEKSAVKNLREGLRKYLDNYKKLKEQC